MSDCRRMVIVGLLLNLSLLTTVYAAGFDCAKARSAMEIKICDTPQLDAADSRLSRAYRALRRALPKPQASALKEEQRRWLKLRDIECRGNDIDTNCLLKMYNRRSTILEFRRSPAYRQSPAGSVSGHYTMVDFEPMQIQANALSEQRVVVQIEGAEPNTGRWVCHFVGEGKLHNRRLQLIDSESDPDSQYPITLVFQGDHVDVSGDVRDGISYYCGAGGTLSGRYRKRR